MPEQVLLIDQGNTRLKWVLASHGEIDTASAGRGKLEEFRRACSVYEQAPQAVHLSSVAGQEQIQSVDKLCRDSWGLEVQSLRTKEEQGGVRNAYAEAGTLGVDRWLAIVGAVSRHGKPVVIWDLGTASTLDAVDQSGQHLGGFIYPGPATMLNSLRRETRLRVPAGLEAGARGAADGKQPGVSPGESTAACISRGVLAAQLGALNQFLRNISVRIEGEPKVIVTGGAATQILPLLELDYAHDPWLVFRGMLVN